MARRTLISVGLLALALSGCETPTGQASDANRPINLTDHGGTPLAPSGEWVPLGVFWSPDGAQVAYESKGFTALATLWAAAVPAGTRRQIEPPRAAPSYSIAFSAAGDALYVVHGDSVEDTRPPRLYRVALDGGTVETVIDSVAALFAPSPDGAHLVYIPWGDTTLWTYDLATGGRRRLTQAGKVPQGYVAPSLVAFSPQGTELLLQRESGCDQLPVVTLATGAARLVDTGLGGEWPCEVRWTADGILVFFSRRRDQGGHDFYVKNATTGVTTRFYEERFQGVVYGFDVSPDGRRVAFWAEVCTRARSILTCEEGAVHDALYVVDVATAREVWVAGTSVDLPRHTRFSPDGTRIAYTISDHPYVSTVP